jgi:hypothetical protein
LHISLFTTIIFTVEAKERHKLKQKSILKIFGIVMDRKEFVELCAKLLKFTSSIYTYNATFFYQSFVLSKIISGSVR